MPSKKKSNDNGNIYYIFTIFLFLFIFFASCNCIGVLKGREQFLSRIKYKCKGKNQIQADSPQIDCRLDKKNNLICNNLRNCECKDIDTGFCTKAYEEVNIKKNQY